MRFLPGHSSKFTRNAYKTTRWIEEDRGFTTPCWIWQLNHLPSGHGRTAAGLAHRRHYEAVHGPLPEGMILHHLCHTSSCVNPEHLEAMRRVDHVRLHAKLTIEDVDAIRASALPLVTLAWWYGVSASHISNIRARRTWASRARRSSA